MKKFRILLPVIFCLNLISSYSYSQLSDIEAEKFVDNLLASNYRENEQGVSVLISKDGKIIYKKAIGLSDFDKRIPLSSENVFAIGSMTKQFTAVAILILVDEGKINLSEDIKNYLPDYNTHGKSITVENLLTHSSGIEGFRTLKKKITSKEELIGAIQDDELLFEPGSNFSYSNSGYYLLGLIIEKVSGMTYQDFIQKNIFDPLKMTHSYFSSKAETIPMLAVSNGQREGNANLISVPFQWSWPLSAGNILSTTGDLFLWNEALNGDKIVPQALLQKAFTPFHIDGITTNYGYGWNVTSLGENTVIEHGGSVNGFVCDAIRVPEQNLYIAALSNNGYKSPAEITQKILLKMLNIPFEKPKAITLNKDLLDQYTGSYEITRKDGRLLAIRNQEKQYYFVTREDDNLKIQSTGSGKQNFYAFEKDKYFSDGDFKRFNFIRDENNIITALEVYDFPVNFGMNDYCRKTNASQLNK